MCYGGSSFQGRIHSDQRAGLLHDAGEGFFNPKPSSVTVGHMGCCDMWDKSGSARNKPLPASKPDMLGHGRLSALCLSFPDLNGPGNPLLLIFHYDSPPGCSLESLGFHAAFSSHGSSRLPARHKQVALLGKVRSCAWHKFTQSVVSL